MQQYTINAQYRAICGPEIIFLTRVNDKLEEIKEIFGAPLQAEELLWVLLSSIDMLSLLRGHQ
jgi:hypothetical protein